MNARFVKGRVWGAAALALVLLGLAGLPARPSGGPVDVPASSEPRVVVATSLSGPGFLKSQGTFEPFERIKADTKLYSRDLLLALPGFQADVEPTSKNVKLTLFGNIPEMSDSHCLESAVVLHDTSHYDIDFTLLRGRVVLTNTNKKGTAKVWLRTEWSGVQFSLEEPDTQVAVEIYGRWAPGVPFSLKHSRENEPTRLWDVMVLKGKLDIKAGANEFHMSAPPGRAYFHGDSVNGPSQDGPQVMKTVPAWANPKAKKHPLFEAVQDVIAQYRKAIETKELTEVPALLLATAAKDKNKDRAMLTRRLLVFALGALDDVHNVVELLNTSNREEVRSTAVITLRHWIGAKTGRDEKLYKTLIDEVGFSKAEAETMMQMLHSPFNPSQAETYDTLIAYLKHRKQAIRELAHWHLVRLAPIGRDIPFDASAAQADRDKAAAKWKELIPSGELPKAPKEKNEK